MKVKRARALIRDKGLPKYDNGYKNLIKLLTNKGFELPEISRAICLEKYKINHIHDKFPQTSINKIKPKSINTNRTNHQHTSENIQLSNGCYICILCCAFDPTQIEQMN